jgi:integrase
MSARKIRRHWYVDFRHEYQRVRKRSPENSRAGALAYEATLRGRLARGQPMIPAPLRRPAAKPRFGAFAWRWYAIYVETNNKPSEQKAKRLMLQNHLIPAFGTLMLDAITTLHAEEFKAAKLNAGLSPKSINNCLAVLGKCLRTAEEWSELDRVPKLKLLRVPPQKFDFLSREEANRLIRAVRDTHWRAMITIALRAGLRLGELVALDWSDVNLETRLLTVRQSAFGDQIGSPKNNRIRHIPLTDEARRTLQPIQRSSGFVFSRNECKPLNDQVARRVIAKLCEEAVIRPVGWHVLRHTFASHLVTAGVSIKAVQELLGHSDVRTTMRYAHLAPSVLQEAIRVLEPTVGSGSGDIFGPPVGNAFTTAEEKTTETP